MKRILIALSALALLSGCEPESGTPQKAPTAGAKHATPKVQQQPAPVQGDPSAHNTQPGEVGLFVSWESENRTTPVCEWSRNGVAQPCANIQAQRDDDSPGWYGFWEHEESGKIGTTYTVNAQGTKAIKSITCEIAWKGVIHPGISQGNRCGASFTLS